MSLYTKCILHPLLAEDGIRISVMSRHTLEDGINPDIRLDRDLHPHIYDEHLPQLASSKLVWAYLRGKITWEEYEIGYLNHLRQPEIRVQVQELARRSLLKDITLLCIEETAKYCHRRLLAEECQRYQPDLVVQHR